MIDLIECPVPGEAFGLTLGDSTMDDYPIFVRQKDPLNVYETPQRWKYNGNVRASVGQTRTFKLVEIAYVYNSITIEANLSRYGVTPDVPWLSAFKATYPQFDDKRYVIGIANPFWPQGNGSHEFLCVNPGNGRSIQWVVYERGVNWLWLVAMRG